MSQPPKTRSSRPARGTKSLIFGVLLSVRLPRRMVAIWLTEPIGLALPFLIASTPAMDGLGVLRRLRERQIEPPHVIFSTAYDQFAVEAFRLEAMDYLLKPVDRERLAESIARARRVVADRIAEPVS